MEENVLQPDDQYQQKLVQLRKLLEEGENSGIAEDFDPEEFITRMRNKYMSV